MCGPVMYAHCTTVVAVTACCNLCVWECLKAVQHFLKWSSELLFYPYMFPSLQCSTSFAIAPFHSVKTVSMQLGVCFVLLRSSSSEGEATTIHSETVNS